VIPRYTTPEMVEIWSDEARYENWFRVELVAAIALENQKKIPAGISQKLQNRAQKINWKKLSDRISEIENTTRHDVISFLSALEEVLGADSRWLHLGLTSSDVVDTVFAYSLQKSALQIGERLSELTKSLLRQAQKYKHTICLARTHGQAAEPTTFGLKLLSFVVEMQRNQERLKAAAKEIAHGKLSGAVGNYGNIDPRVEEAVMQELGLIPELVSTQIVPRDRHAVFFGTLAVIAGGLERLAVEIRHLMRTEVAEAFEPFGQGQRGSSAMPHKKNPILTENVTGLARLIRSYAIAAYENQALWHERDISHSSVERVIAPDATSILDFALLRMTQVVSGLEVDAENMKKHVDAAKGLIFSESILLILAQKGILRQTAYQWVQRAAMQARQGQGEFLLNLKSDSDIAQVLSAQELDKAFDVEHHLRHVDFIFTRVSKHIYN
jgi:adenylosuccinate lyase